MTSITYQQAGAASAGGTLPGLAASLLRYWSRQRTARMIADLDDHILRDIGLNSGDVRRSREAMRDWVLDTRSETGRLVFIGR